MRGFMFLKESHNSPVAITSDIDWAPDYAIRWMADKLKEFSIKATFFVTHETPELNNLRKNSNLFELGIHPNFLPGSSHGATVEEVLSTCLKVVPEAVSMRTHALFQSTLILQKATATPIRNDCSLFLPGTPNVSAHKLYLGTKIPLNRFPFSWEDDIEQVTPQKNWSFSVLPEQKNYLMLNFHPLLVYLNDVDGASYKELKAKFVRITHAPKDEADKLINKGDGPRTAFLKALIMAKNRSLNVKDLYDVLDQAT
ncbi:hypothetical protein BROC_02281 [Candidatus Brocadiaceae bacterium]|nr:hypothetical protein BROC_02281 [Candidatus Brocadiaceae bacterium]